MNSSVQSRQASGYIRVGYSGEVEVIFEAGDARRGRIHRNKLKLSKI
jgi:hypothetical protein